MKRPTAATVLSLLTLLAASCRAQEPASPSFPGVEMPRSAPCPSVVASPTEKTALVLGTYDLTTQRPAVVDGDTIRVDGLDRSLRLLGIDTEETFRNEGKRTLARSDWQEYLKTVYAGTKRDRPPKFGTPFGEAAKDFAHRFFEGLKQVRLEYDDPARKRGYFNRHLVHVLARKDGRWINFNVEVVRQGLSPYFMKYGRCQRYHAAFLEAEKEARDSGRGMWATKPAYPCYPDYPVRLVWWLERDRDMQVVRFLRKKATDLFVLGEDEDWNALKKSAGRTVRVAGVPGRLIRKGQLGLQTVGHRNKNDFIIVGPAEKVAEMGLEENAGNMMVFTGKVSIYRDKPQFRIEDLKSFVRLPAR